MTDTGDFFFPADWPNEYHDGEAVIVLNPDNEDEWVRSSHVIEFQP